MIRHPNILKRESAALLIIDVQEKLTPVIAQMEKVEQNIIRLIKGCKILDVPVFYTEQYPKGLGKTLTSITSQLKPVKPVEKMHFSVCCSKDLMMTLREGGYGQIIIAGIEAHVCVLQSALDLTQEGFQVHVVEDAVNSRDQRHKQIAIQRLLAQSITVTTTESVLFELTKVSGTEDFKKVAKLIK